MAILPAQWHGAALAVSFGVALWIARHAPWHELLTPGRLHLFLGFVVALMVLWSMRAGIRPGLNFHLLGAMAATLCLGPPLAIAALGLTVTALVLNGSIEWQAWPINFLLMAALPVWLADRLRRGIELWLPQHLFVFLIGIGFMGAGAVIMLQGLAASLVLLLAGAYPGVLLSNEYLPYLLLLGFAEAWISGAIVTLFVVYRPEWVVAFDERRYLLGK